MKDLEDLLKVDITVNVILVSALIYLLQQFESPLTKIDKNAFFLLPALVAFGYLGVFLLRQTKKEINEKMVIILEAASWIHLGMTIILVFIVGSYKFLGTSFGLLWSIAFWSGIISIFVVNAAVWSIAFSKRK